MASCGFDNPQGVNGYELTMAPGQATRAGLLRAATPDKLAQKTLTFVDERGGRYGSNETRDSFHVGADPERVAEAILGERVPVDPRARGNERGGLRRGERALEGSFPAEHRLHFGR